MATVTRTFELSPEAAAELDRRAQEEIRHPSEVLNDLLLEDSLGEEDFTPEQWAMILEGEADAKAGRFASPEEIEAILGKYRAAS